MKAFFKVKGQSLTPREGVHFAIAMTQPDNSLRVLDPACGSGSFRLNTMEYIRKYAKNNYTNPLEIYNHWNAFVKNRLFGIEINGPIAHVGQMNMILHDAGHSNIIHTDSLDDIEPRIQCINKKFQKSYFDLVLTNPPFGVRVQGSEKEYLKSYILGHNKNKPRNSQKIEILFIERCVEF